MPYFTVTLQKLFYVLNSEFIKVSLIRDVKKKKSHLINFDKVLIQKKNIKSMIHFTLHGDVKKYELF